MRLPCKKILLDLSMDPDKLTLGIAILLFRGVTTFSQKRYTPAVPEWCYPRFCWGDGSVYHRLFRAKDYRSRLLAGFVNSPTSWGKLQRFLFFWKSKQWSGAGWFCSRPFCLTSKGEIP